MNPPTQLPPKSTSTSLWGSFVAAFTPDKTPALPDVYGPSNANKSGSLDSVPKNLLDPKGHRDQNANLRLAIRAPLVDVINSNGLQVSATIPGTQEHEICQLVISDVLRKCEHNALEVTENTERAQKLNPESQRSTIEGNDKDVLVKLSLDQNQQAAFKQLFSTLIEAQLEMNQRYKLNPDNPERVQLKGQQGDRYSLYIENKKNGGADEFILTYTDNEVDAKSTFKLMFLANTNQYDWSKISGELPAQPLPPGPPMPKRPLPPAASPAPIPIQQSIMPASQSARFGLSSSSRPPAPLPVNQVSQPVRFQGQQITPPDQQPVTQVPFPPNANFLMEGRTFSSEQKTADSSKPQNKHVPHYVEISPFNTNFQTPQLAREKVVSDPLITKDSSRADKEAENKRLTQWLLQKNYNESVSPDVNFTSYLVSTRKLYDGAQPLVFRDGEIRLPEGSRRVAWLEIPAGLRLENFRYSIAGALAYQNGSVTTSTGKLMAIGPNASGRAEGLDATTSASGGATAEAGQGGTATANKGSTLIRLDTQFGTTLVATEAGVTIIDKESGRSYITKGPFTLQFNQPLPVDD